jgi:hypothetical protein
MHILNRRGKGTKELREKAKSKCDAETMTNDKGKYCKLTAFLSFFLTISGPSRRSIFESGSEADILPPVRPAEN